MKKKYSIVFILILFCFCAISRGSGLVCSGGVASVDGGGCESQSYISGIEATTLDSASDIYTDASSRQRGQSFTSPATSVDLYSVIVYISTNNLEASESGTLTIRLHTAADMSGGGSAQGTTTVAFAETGEIEVILSSPWAMPTSSTIYFLADWTQQSPDSLLLGRSDTSVYAGGQGWWSDGDWIADGSYPSNDFYFKLRKCD